MKVGNNPDGAAADFGRIRPASGPASGAAPGSRIDGVSTLLPAGRTTGAAPDALPVATGSGAVRPVDGVEPGQTVHLSPESRSLARAAAAVDGEPEIRQAKVDAIRKAIDDKTYKVDPHAIADKLIQEASQLMQAIGAGGVSADGGAAQEDPASPDDRSRGRIEPPDPAPLPGSGELLPDVEVPWDASATDGQEAAQDPGREGSDGHGRSPDGAPGQPDGLHAGTRTRRSGHHVDGLKATHANAAAPYVHGTHPRH